MSNPVLGWQHTASLPHPESERLMIIEDEPRLRESSAQLLARENREIITCENGAEALARLAEQDVDVVLLDLNLPDMSGIEVLNQLRKIPSSAVVIVVSADNQINSAIQALRLRRL